MSLSGQRGPDETPTNHCQGTSALTILATADLHGTTPNYDYFTGKPFTDDKADQKNRTCGLGLLSPRSQTLARAKAGNPW